MEKMRYHGFYIPRETFQDNTNFYKKCLSNPLAAASIGVSKLQAIQNIEMLKNYPPNEEHSRLSGHIVSVSSYENPSWVKRGQKFVKPKGKTNEIFSIDMGDYIMDLCKKESSSEEIVQKNAVIDLGDGTVIRGDIIRKSPHTGFANSRNVYNSHLKITFGKDDELEKRSYIDGLISRIPFHYDFHILLDSITPENPKFYSVQKYTKMNNEYFFSGQETAEPVFKSADGKTPQKFGFMLYTNN